MENKQNEFMIEPYSFEYKIRKPVEVEGRTVEVLGKLKFICKDNGIYQVSVPFKKSQFAQNPDVLEAVFDMRERMQRALISFGERLVKAWEDNQEVFDFDEENQLKLFEVQLGVAQTANDSKVIPDLNPSNPSDIDNPNPNLEFTAKDLAEADDEFPFGEEEPEQAVDDEVNVEKSSK